MPTAPLRRQLEQIAVEQHRRQQVMGRQYDLARFTDDEIEELSELAQKAEEANAAGQSVIWTAQEMLVFDRLGAKHEASGRDRRHAGIAPRAGRDHDPGAPSAADAGTRHSRGLP